MLFNIINIQHRALCKADATKHNNIIRCLLTLVNRRYVF
nr:MAG TPA: hypothetical protein [Caudoviricetes sp.]